jgi:CRISPR-associated protein Csb2
VTVLALRVTYLLGRVYSARFEDGDGKGDPEWPPHPSRLFSALTAAWGEGGAEEELRPALEWLEQQAPPRILFSSQTARKLVQAFVPVNDAETVPEERPRKGRVFPSASLAEPDVYFVWDASPAEDVRAKLDRILLRASSLGHSSSLVSIEIAEAVNGDGLTDWRPGVPRGQRLRIVSEGRMGELIARHRRFSENGWKIHRPNAGKTTLYGPVDVKRVEAARGIFEQMIVVKQIDGPRTSLRSALSLTAALRGAILKFGPQPVPEYLSGHAPGSTPEAPVRSDIPHVAFVPLANVGFRHSTGELMGVALVLPGSFTRDERQVCWRAAEAIRTLGTAWGEWTVKLADAEERRWTLLAETWMGKGLVWATVTPFVFDRYPKDPYGDAAEQVVRDAFIRSGFPAPIEVDLHYNPWLTGVPKASAFPPAQARPGKPQRYHCHVRARFERAVEGPVLAGAGRFYGYGLFRQIGGGR